MSIEPRGYYVLIEMDEIDEKSKGGIILGDKDRRQEACDIGTIKAIGPTAFRGVPGCDPTEYPPGHEFHRLMPHQIWGVDVGDRVEYRRFEGKLSGEDGCDRMRYIPDTQILGKAGGAS